LPSIKNTTNSPDSNFPISYLLDFPIEYFYLISVFNLIGPIMKSIKIRSAISIVALVLFCTPQLRSQTNLQPDSLDINLIQLHNYADFTDVTTILPSVFSLSTGIIGSFTPFTIDGFNSHQSSLFFKGLLITDPWSGQSDLGLIPVEDLQAVHLNSLSNSFGLSGLNSLFITQKPLSGSHPLTKIVYRSGGNKFNDLDITFGKKITSAISLVSSVQLMNNLESNSPGFLKKQVIRSTLIYKPSVKWHFEYSIMQNRSKVDLPWQISLPGDTISLKNPRLERLRYDQILRTHNKFVGLETELNFTTSYEKFQFHNADFRRRIIPVRSFRLFIEQKIPEKIKALSWGGQFNFRDLITLSNTKKADRYHSIFLKYQRKLNTNISDLTQLGSHISGDNKIYFTFRQDVFFHLNKLFSFSIGLNRSIREPSLGERFSMPFSFTPSLYDSLTNFTSSPSLMPEKNLNIYSSFKLQSGSGFLKLKPFYLRTSSPILPFNKGVTTEITNGTFYEKIGVTLSLSTGVIKHFSLISYFNTQKIINKNAQPLYFSPKFSAYSALSWQNIFFEDDLHINITLGLRLYKFTHLTDNTADLFNLKIDALVIRNARISLEMDNIFDNKYYIFNNMALRGRTIRFGLNWTFLD